MTPKLVPSLGLVAGGALVALAGWAATGPSGIHDEGAPSSAAGPTDAGPAAGGATASAAPAVYGVSEEQLSLLGARSGQAVGSSRSADRTSPHVFHFTRAIYSSGRFGRGFRSGPWATDYPKADEQFLIVLDATLDLLDVADEPNAVELDDPEIRRFPYLYMLEVGFISLTESEIRGLRDYLRAGGFLVVDDFWGPYEWRNFERQMRRVFPDRPIEELPLDHPIFHTFYDIEEILQVPNTGDARAGVIRECGGGPCGPARVRGIFDDRGRLMAVINFNTDLGDAWEWSEQPHYPFRFSNFAYKMAVNFILYSMTH